MARLANKNESLFRDFRFFRSWSCILTLCVYSVQYTIHILQYITRVVESDKVFPPSPSLSPLPLLVALLFFFAFAFAKQSENELL